MKLIEGDIVYFDGKYQQITKISHRNYWKKKKVFTIEFKEMDEGK